ncbi:MAG: GNAT family N-acetyltransferase [Candidatus Niyogibacteria bacterium]|nr:MAG: GNAT family N-acetyltransferase [Candidatus Niyogibacteria bacterium]
MQVIIRKAELRDAKVIAELHKKVVSEVNSKFYPVEAIEEWSKDISEKNVKNQFRNSDWIVAEAGNKLVGFGQYLAAEGRVFQINVSPEYLNQSIGRKLYDYMENDFISKKVEKIELNSTLNAIGFYQKLGFKMVEEIYIGSIKMIKMEKSLRASQ